MCEPISATTAVIYGIGIAATLAGTATSIVAAQEQQQAQNKAASYNASIQDRNAQVADMQAADATARGDIAAKEHLQLVKGAIGAQRASAGASGLVPDEGSPLTITEDTGEFGKLDALTIQNNAAREAWGYKNTSANDTASANLLRSSQGSSGAAVAGSILTGVSKLGSQLYQYNQTAGSSSIPTAKATPYYTSSFPRATPVNG